MKMDLVVKGIHDVEVRLFLIWYKEEEGCE